MRKFLTLLFIIGCYTSYSAPITLKVTNGSWTASSWDLNRLPSDNDIIVIPANTTLTLSLDINLKNVLFEVYGRILLDGNNMKLDLDNASKIMVYAGGTIQGTKNSQQIRLNNILFKGDNNVVYGPMMAIATSSGFIPFVESIIPLPVKYLGFSAVRKNADVLVQWATSQEMNANYYEIERSEDGASWTLIGKVNAAGTTSNTTNYSFTDRNVNSKTAYYRIKQIDLDGRFEYTAVKTVKGEGNAVNVAAVRGNIVLQFSKQVQGQVEVRLVSISGHVVSRQLLNRPVGQLILPATYKGNYIVTVSDQQDIQINKQIHL